MEINTQHVINISEEETYLTPANVEPRNFNRRTTIIFPLQSDCIFG
jgi:polyphosphate kinase